MVFYGFLQGDADYSGVRAAVQGHFGERDQAIPANHARAVLERVRTQGRVPVQVYFYDAGHAFFNDENLLGTYNEDAARLACSRTVEFLRSALARS